MFHVAVTVNLKKGCRAVVTNLGHLSLVGIYPGRVDCSQSPIFPFDRRDRAQIASEHELGRAT